MNPLFQSIAGFRKAILVFGMGFFFLGTGNHLTVEAASVPSSLISIETGKSMVLTPPSSVKRVSVGAPEIADFVLISSEEIYIQGKAPGATNLIVWQKNGATTTYDVEVTSNLSSLKARLHQALPNETEIRVYGEKESLTLMGKVSSAASLKQALYLAEAAAPKGKVNNLLEVGGVHQVMLEVKIAEISRSTGKELGFNYNYVRGGKEYGISLLDGLSQIVPPDDANMYTHPEFGTLISPAVNALYRFTSGKTQWTAILNALKEDGLAKILAEPTLIALSGKSASFLAGGEFPIPIPDNDGIGIEYKQFGVRLSFSPTVLDNGKINIKVMPEVSELDFSTAVRLTGYVVPGLTKRTTETTIDLADGQSFAIAGLLQESVRENASKFPFLGDVPILGVLFSSKSFQKNETELVVIVTPHLVKPLDKEVQTSPTDFYNETSDFEFYFNTVLKGGEKKSANPPVSGGFDGEFGHSISDQE